LTSGDTDATPTAVDDYFSFWQRVLGREVFWQLWLQAPRPTIPAAGAEEDGEPLVLRESVVAPAHEIMIEALFTQAVAIALPIQTDTLTPFGVARPESAKGVLSLASPPTPFADSGRATQTSADNKVCLLAEARPALAWTAALIGLSSGVASVESRRRPLRLS